MTTRRTHTCNLCHSSVANEVMGVGLRWGLKNQIEFTTPGEAETHICQPCLGSIETALRELHEASAARAAAAAE